MPFLIFLLLAVALPVVASLVVIKKLRTLKRRYKIPLVFLVVISVWVGLFYVFSLIYPNKAERELNATFHNLKSLNGQMICYNSDSGYGIANRTPWYDAYYRIPSANPEDTIKDLASKNGYSLSMDDELRKALINPSTASYYDLPGNIDEFYSYDPTNSYFEASRNGYDLDIAIHRKGSARLFCNSGDWDRLEPVPSGSSIIRIYITAPELD